MEPSKHCIECGELKPLSDFYRAAGMRDGHRNDCKVCNLAAKKQRYVKDPEAHIQRVKRWQQENAERLNEYRRERRKRPDVKRRECEGHLRRKYGITVDEYDALLEQQGGGCAICGREPREDISLHVDHDHETGRVRGLTCFRCNNALGDFSDDPELLQAAIRYLDSHDPEYAEMADLTRERLRGLATTGR